MIMDGLGKRVSKYPKIAIIIVLAITMIAMFSMQYNGIDQDFSEESFMPDMEIAQASDEISEKFTTTNSVSILVKSTDGDVLTSDALVEMLEVEKKFLEEDVIVSALETPAYPSGSINSVADVIAQMALVEQGNFNPTMDEKISVLKGLDGNVKNTIQGIFESDQTPPEVLGVFSMLLTKDFDPNDGQFNAKGTMIIISLNPSMADGGGGFASSEDSQISKAEKKMDEIVKDTKLESTEITVMGGSIISEEIMNANNESMAILLPLAFGFVIIILAIIYRNGFDMLVSLLALGFSIIWVYGFGAAMGYSFNPMTTAVPILIVGLGIDYGIHITMRYREEIKKGKKIEDAINLTIISVGMALLLATVTTVVSFLSNIASPIGILGEFGILAAIGIIGSFITMTTFVPACKQLRDNRRLKKGKFNLNNSKNNTQSKIKSAGVNTLNKAMGTGATAAEHHPLAVIVVVAFITVGSVGLATQLETTFDFNDFLPEGLDITKDIDFMMEEFSITSGTSEQVNILVKGDISDPNVLRDIDETVRNMNDDQYVIKNATDDPDVNSILSVMKDWATNTNSTGIQDSNYDPVFKANYSKIMTDSGVPNQQATKEDINSLYDYICTNPNIMKDAKNVLYKTDEGIYDSTVLRIPVSVSSTDNQEIDDLREDLEKDIKPLESSADTVIITGGPILTKAIMDSLNQSQIRSLIITIILSFIVLTIVFYFKWRSIILGLITITPVAFCVAWTLGTMYLINIPLNMMTITIASLTVGLGITYGIHVTHRFLNDLENHNSVDNFIIRKKVRCPDCGKTLVVKGRPGEVVMVNCESCGAPGKVTFHKTSNDNSNGSSYIDDACRTTVTHTGTALFGAATTTIAGFGLLVFALMPPIQQFGGITALTILFSFLASVFVLPTFLVMWAKYKDKHKK